MGAGGSFDEMGLGAANVRPLYREIARWLEETPPEVLASRRAQAEYMFRRIGITFGVYGDKDAAERLIPFDIVPRVISRAEWTSLEAGLTQRVNALNLFLKDVYGPRAILKENIVPEELILRNPYYRPEMIGRRAAARHLGAYRRHRHRARRRGRVLRARGQCAHALRRLLHAGKPRSDDAPDAGPVRAPPRRSGRRLSRRVARLPALGDAAPERERRLDRAADAGPLQFGLLRALVPRRQARRRTGRGAGPVRRRRRRLHAHDARPQARRRHLSPGRRRVPRSARVQSGFASRRARAGRRLFGGQCDYCQCSGDRRRRRQGDLQLRSRPDPLLSLRGALVAERADLSLPRAATC